MRCGVMHSNAGRQRFRTAQYALVYIVAGRGVFEDGNGNEYEFRRGSFFQRFPDEAHVVTWQDVVQAYVAVPAVALSMLRMTSDVRSGYVCDVRGDPRRMVKRFYTVANRLNDAGVDSLDALMDMIRLMRDLHAAATERDETPHVSKMARACRMLAADMRGRLRVEQVARDLDMSVSGFHKAFRAHSGTTPAQYRIARRVDVAVEYVVSTNQTFTEIAHALGYPDLYTFSTQFKKVTGLSPSACRERTRGAHGTHGT
jgi:AraC-like DNA-binding protein